MYFSSGSRFLAMLSQTRRSWSAMLLVAWGSSPSSPKAVRSSAVNALPFV